MPLAVAEGDSSMEKKRIAWPDASKGIAILLVVLIHTERAISNAGIEANRVFWNGLYYFGYAFMVRSSSCCQNGLGRSRVRATRTVLCPVALG